MNRKWIYATAAVCLASTALFATAIEPRFNPVSSEALLAADGSYRDGLYVGKFMRAQGAAMNPPIGRWSTDEERSEFLAGYERGYDKTGN